MSKSKQTKNALLILWILKIIDFAILSIPITVYLIKNLGTSQNNSGKIACVSVLAIAAILGIFNVILQKHLRCIIWIILLGIMIINQNILPLVIMIAVGSIVDELILLPLISYFKTAYISNKQIDRRFRG